MTLLTRDAILAADDRPTRTVAVPEWGGEVTVRGLSGAERDAYETSIVQQRPDGSTRTDLRNIRARLVALACVDGDGNRLFTDGDVDALGAKSANALDRVFTAASSLSGLSQADLEVMAEGFTTAP